MLSAPVEIHVNPSYEPHYFDLSPATVMDIDKPINLLIIVHILYSAFNQLH